LCIDDGLVELFEVNFLAHEKEPFYRGDHSKKGLIWIAPALPVFFAIGDVPLKLWK